MANSLSTSAKKLGHVRWSKRKAVPVDVLAQVVVQSILVSLQYGQLHALVCPQTVECGETLLWHVLLDADFGVSRDELGETL